MYAGVPGKTISGGGVHCLHVHAEEQEDHDDDGVHGLAATEVGLHDRKVGNCS